MIRPTPRGNTHRILPSSSFRFAPLLFLFLWATLVRSMILIPMDESQTNHLRAYGVVFRALEKGVQLHWCLNYRGGSFVAENAQSLENDARIQGVEVEKISPAQWTDIMDVIENNNMEKVKLEKAPKIAVYTPPNKLPWDDAVTLALTYAGIPYNKIYDEEVLGGNLSDYDWLHLHHEDFTGQYSKFHASFRSTAWYQRQKLKLEKIASDMGFASVAECKKAVALAIRKYVEGGGFLFAMCSATNTLEIALAALGTDIAPAEFDGDPVDPSYRQKLDYSNCFAFENFKIHTDPMSGYFGSIDLNLVNSPMRQEVEDFVLFNFSAKLDPIPTMLTQNHTSTVKGYFGLLTSYRRSVIKKSVIILGEVPGTEQVNYIHGVKGKGMFAFLGGHDPEDRTHAVGDKPTMLDLHKASPGYRLILNNVLFPAAEKKEKKT